jgi:hypothetical protein
METLAYSKIKDIVLFKGKKAKSGPVHTMNITIDHIRAVFFPKDFYETYRYLGSVPYNEKGEMFKYLKPLVIFMDYRAKPKWCPRWFLRFLHLFGNDNSIVRVRSFRLHNLFNKITKGYGIVDFKTKWTNYDLRISIHGGEAEWWLSNAIEEKFYREGHKENMLSILKDTKYADQVGQWSTYCEIVEVYRKSQYEDNEE